MGTSDVRRVDAVTKTSTWQADIMKEDKSVLEVLLSLSKTPRYDVVPHVLGVSITGFAIAHTQNIELLDWIYTKFDQEYASLLSFCIETWVGAPVSPCSYSSLT